MYNVNNIHASLYLLLLVLVIQLRLILCNSIDCSPPGPSVHRSSNTLATWCKESTHWKRPWCWERLRAGGKGDDRGWDDWMPSPTRWTWVWVSSGSWWWTWKPGVLQPMESQRVVNNLATEWQQFRVGEKGNFTSRCRTSVFRVGEGSWRWATSSIK